VKATLTSKGQITIPQPIRQRLGLKSGQVLEFDETAPYLKATRVIEPGAWKSFGKKAVNPWPKLSGGEIIEKMRGPVALPARRQRR